MDVKPAFLVVAKNEHGVNKFQQDSMLEAVNLRDFLDGLSIYQEVTIFQHSFSGASDDDWVKVSAMES